MGGVSKADARTSIEKLIAADCPAVLSIKHLFPSPTLLLLSEQFINAPRFTNFKDPKGAQGTLHIEHKPQSH